MWVAGRPITDRNNLWIVGLVWVLHMVHPNIPPAPNRNVFVASRTSVTDNTITWNLPVGTWGWLFVPPFALLSPYEFLFVPAVMFVGFLLCLVTGGARSILWKRLNWTSPSARKRARLMDCAHSNTATMKIVDHFGSEVISFFSPTNQSSQTNLYPSNYFPGADERSAEFGVLIQLGQVEKAQINSGTS